MRALAELSLESGYAAATIDQIAERADLGRATFYTHFRDKDDLLAQMVAELREDLDARIADAAKPDDVGFSGAALTALFEHAAAEPQMYRLVLRGTGDGLPLRELMEMTARTTEQLWSDRAKEFGSTPRVPLTVAAWAWTGQTLTLLRWWLEAETPYDPKHMATMARDIALRGHLWAQGFSPMTRPRCSAERDTAEHLGSGTWSECREFGRQLT